MKGGIDEGKELRPMFPRLHIKDAEKGGPKAPPRNKMALYEQFSIPSQSFASGSASLLPLPFRNNCPVPSTSPQAGGCLSIQFCTSNAPSYLAEERIQAYHSNGVNLTKLTPDGFINCKNSLKKVDNEDAFIIPNAANGRNSRCSISQNIKDKGKVAHSESSSLKSQNSISKKVNSAGSIELRSAQYEKNQMEEHSEVGQIGQMTELKSTHPLAGFGKMTDASSISSLEFRNPKSMKKAHASFKEEIKSISADSLKLLKGSDALTHKEHTALRDKTNLRDGHLEKPAVNNDHKCPDGLKIGRKCFQGKRHGHEDAEIYKHHGDSNEPITDSILGGQFYPDDVLGAIGEKQFWKARRTIINQQRIFLVQVFELHRLMKVQRLIAASPHLLLDDNLFLNKPSKKMSALEKLQTDYVTEQPSSAAKLNSKSEITTTAERAENNVVGKIPPPCATQSIGKGVVDQLSNYGQHSGNPPLAPAATNVKHSQFIYPPSGNQWLVPIMSPSEGLVYKPFIGPCPPNAGCIAPMYGACGTMSLNPESEDVSDRAHITSHQGVGILSGITLPKFFPPCGPPIMHQPVSPSAVEQMSPSTKMQCYGPENYQSAGGINSSILNQSSSNMSIRISQEISTQITNYHSFKDNELHRSTASSPSNKMKVNIVPLFPVSPTFWASTDQNAKVIDNQPQVIKALPHNPKSATESAARIFKSIQEERKYL